MARRVTTPEGAAYFGVPIGSIIGTGPIESEEEGVAKKAKKVRPLVGMSSANANPNATPGVSPTNNAGPTVQRSVQPNSGEAQDNKRYGEQPNDFRPMDFAPPGYDLKKNYSNAEELVVGGQSFYFPEGSIVRESPFNNEIKYVTTPDGSFTVVTKKGELILSPEMQARMVRLMVDAFGDDENGDKES